MADRPRVHGIGGVFFKAEDPDALAKWYAEHLDVGGQGWGGHIFNWKRADTGGEAMTVWSPFKATTEYFLPSEKAYMVNLRVDDLDGTLRALRSEGCNVLERYESNEQGKFGYVLDPEGGLVELWEPPAAEPGAA
jgi:predicted enzyme related to lactoylglutathione lyase